LYVIEKAKKEFSERESFDKDFNVFQIILCISWNNLTGTEI